MRHGVRPRAGDHRAGRLDPARDRPGRAGAGRRDHAARRRGARLAHPRARRERRPRGAAPDRAGPGPVPRRPRRAGRGREGPLGLGLPGPARAGLRRGRRVLALGDRDDVSPLARRPRPVRDPAARRGRSVGQGAARRRPRRGAPRPRRGGTARGGPRRGARRWAPRCWPRCPTTTGCSGWSCAARPAASSSASPAGTPHETAARARCATGAAEPARPGVPRRPLSPRMPRELAFWAALTGWEVRQGSVPGFTSLRRPDGIPVRLLLQRLGEATGTARAHVDFACLRPGGRDGAARGPRRRRRAVEARLDGARRPGRSPLLPAPTATPLTGLASALSRPQPERRRAAALHRPPRRWLAPAPAARQGGRMAGGPGTDPAAGGGGCAHEADRLRSARGDGRVRPRDVAWQSPAARPVPRAGGRARAGAAAPCGATSTRRPTLDVHAAGGRGGRGRGAQGGRARCLAGRAAGGAVRGAAVSAA